MALNKGYIAAIVFLLLFIGLSFSSYATEGGWALLLFFISLGIAFRSNAKLKGFSFTTMIFGVVSAGMYYPQFFLHAGGFKLTGLIIPLLQLIMFGMGCELRLRDLETVRKIP